MPDTVRVEACDNDEVILALDGVQCGVIPHDARVALVDKICALLSDRKVRYVIIEKEL